jgi:hypothetical protein
VSASDEICPLTSKHELSFTTETRVLGQRITFPGLSEGR